LAVLATVFLSTLLLSFAFALLVAGMFGSYFGQGRSRAVGFVLSLVALLLLGLFAALTWEVVPGLQPIFNATAVGQALVAVVAATLGTLVAIAVFVGVVMRS
jgi:uncharacterized membrane protein